MCDQWNQDPDRSPQLHQHCSCKAKLKITPPHIIVICAKYIQQSTLKAGYLPGIQDYGSGGVKCGAFLHTEKAEEGDQAVFPLSFASCSQTICSTHDHRSPV